MDSVKLNQIVNKVNELLGGADDCFNEDAGYIILTDTDKIVINRPEKYHTDYFAIALFNNQPIAVERQGLDEDSVIELLNK